MHVLTVHPVCVSAGLGPAAAAVMAVTMDQILAGGVTTSIGALAVALFRLTFLIAKLINNNQTLHRDQQRLWEAFESMRQVVAGLHCVNPLDPGVCPAAKPESDTDFKVKLE